MITQYGYQITTIGYHMNWPDSGDPYYNGSSNNRRNYYGISSIPAARLDGMSQSCSNWSGVIPGLLNSPAPISIDLTESSYDPGSHKVCLKAIVHCETSMGSGDFKIYPGLSEDDLWAGGRHYNRVCRLIYASGNGIIFTISPGETKLISCSLTLNASWVTDKMSAFCWVQNFSTKAVENSIQMDFSDIPIGVGVTPASLGNIKATYR
jgi:hypothetical protein